MSLMSSLMLSDCSLTTFNVGCLVLIIVNHFRTNSGFSRGQLQFPGTMQAAMVNLLIRSIMAALICARASSTATRH